MTTTNNLFERLPRFNMAGKTVIVTGASRGIGEATARALGRAGARVVIASRKREACEQVAQTLASEGIEALPVACHMAKADDLQHLVDATVGAYGGIDVIVHNAATNPAFGPVLDSDAGIFDKIMDVNVKGPFLLSKLAFPHLEKAQARGGGSLVFLSSVGGISPEPFLGLYSVSKAAVISLAKTLAREWGGVGIRSNAVCPGIIKTRFSEALWSNDDILKHAVETQPLPRIGTPEEVADLILFLASDAASYCTGAVYAVDGGHTI